MGRSLWWVGGSGNWSDDDNHWATSSGGSGGDGNLPTSSDDVYFDANSFDGADQTVTLDVDSLCHDIVFTGVTNTPTMAFGNKDLSVYGDLTFVSGMSLTAGSGYLGFEGSDARSVDFGGQTLPFSVYPDVSGNITFTSDITLTEESFEIFGLYTTGAVTIDMRNISFLGSSIDFSGIDVSGGTTVLLDSTDITIVEQYNEAWIYAQNSTADTFSLDGTTLIVNGDNGDVYFSENTSGISLTLNGTGTDVPYGTEFNNLTLAEGTATTFGYDSGENAFTVSGNFTAIGSSGNEITLSKSGGLGDAQFVFSKSSGTVECDYLDISNSSVTGGAHWYAGDNSTDSGNNSGWIFTDRKYPLPPFRS